MEYYSCDNMEQLRLITNGGINGERKRFFYCCEPLRRIPRVLYQETPEATLRDFFEYRDQWIEESKRFSRKEDTEGRELTAAARFLSKLNEIQIPDFELELYSSEEIDRIHQLVALEKEQR